MENKNEKSMTLEEMISEMLKDAKVVKVPLPVRAEEKTEAQKQEKPMPARPSSVPVLSLNIENLHLHMDERMTVNHEAATQGGVAGAECEETCDDDDIDFEEMIRYIRRHTGLCERVILTVLGAQIDYLDTVIDEEDEV